MRIRRRARDVVQPSPAPSSPGFPLSPAPPVGSPRGFSPPSCSGAAAPAGVKPPPSVPFEVDGTTREATPLGPHRTPLIQDRQEEEDEEGADGTGRQKRRGRDGGAEHGHGVTAYVSSRTHTKVDEEERRQVEDKATVVICKKGDGKGWRCKREAQHGCSLCQYHLAKLRSYSRKKKRTEAASPPLLERHATTGDPLQSAARRKKARNEEQGESKGAILAGGFYYYSGFGPRWGKRRGGRADDGRADVTDRGASGVRRHGDRLDDAAVAQEDDYGPDGVAADGKLWKSRSLYSLL